MRSPSLRRAAPLEADAAAVALGLLSGVAGAVAYYSPTWRPLAHTFSVWITLVAVLSAGQTTYRAVRSSFLGLMSAVVAFYVGLTVYYERRYGLPLGLNVEAIVLFGVFALAAAVVLGWTFRGIGRPGWAGAAATAAALGLLAGDAVRRIHNYPADGPVVLTAAAAGILLVLALSSPRRPDVLRTALLTPAAIVVGVALVTGPDAIEQILLR